MKILKLLTGFAVVVVCTSGFAVDITVGTVLAFDRDARILVLTDRTVWSLAESSAPIPDDLEAGARVQFSYESDEDGIADIIEIRVSREALGQGATDVAQGTVLAYDRKARLLVFEDKTTWSLDTMTSSLPFGLDAGDRVEIRYESDEDGVVIIKEISILLD